MASTRGVWSINSSERIRGVFMVRLSLTAHRAEARSVGDDVWQRGREATREQDLATG